MWKFASTFGGENPDVVLVGIGVEVTFEVIEAAAMLHKMVPELRVRVVNVTDLMVLGPYGSHPHALSEEAFESLFTSDKPVHFSYHGYAIELKGLIFGRPNMDRVTVSGYQEEGTTTTPLAVSRHGCLCHGQCIDNWVKMLVLNNLSRYDVARFAVQAVRRKNPNVDAIADKLVQEIDKRVEDFWVYIKENGKGVNRLSPQSSRLLVLTIQQIQMESSTDRYLTRYRA